MATQRKRFSTWVAAITAATVVELSSEGLAVRPAAAGDAPLAHDKGVYLKYCGSCHGPAGKGDGLLSGYLNPKPTDLTQLQKKAGGKWEPVAVARAIDGTRNVGAHGTSDMPVWGEVLREQGESPGGVQRKIDEIVDYLHSIQEQ